MYAKRFTFLGPLRVYMVPNQCIDYLCFSATASPEDAEKLMIGSLISEKAALCGISNVWLLTD